ncbi:DNA repair protein RecO [Candidatus Peregrinibacteria bacterium]|nr:DNA repair protein RecO [Candidatus Peregrinibacteria bacterium]
MRNLLTDAIVLKKFNIGENDVIVVLFSPILGRIEAKAKGARKINSHFIGHLETLNICKVQLYKTSARYTLTDCQAHATFKNIKNDLILLSHSYIILELLYLTAYSNENSTEIFNEVLNVLNTIEIHKTLLILDAFKLKILKLSGNLPLTSFCTNCQQKFSTDKTITITDEAQILCTNCNITASQHIQVDHNIIRLMHYLNETPINEIKKIKFTKKQHSQLKEAINIFLNNFLHQQLKTEEFSLHLN